MQLPESFLKSLSSVLSEAEVNLFTDAIQQEIPVSVRLNSNKISDLQIDQQVPWCVNGFYLTQRPKFIFDPDFHAGAYYVQEAGSMLIEQALKQHVNLSEPIKVLDLCASPGGKSTHVLSLISDDSLLVSNEVIHSRIQALEQNLVRWGSSNFLITQNDPSAFSSFKGQFDIILVDAPCSGEGMFRKHAHAVSEWSEQNVNHCAARQNRILEDVWPSLKEDGLLIYSTCTYNVQENEYNIQNFLANVDGVSLKVNLPEQWNVLESKHDEVFGYRMMPHRTRSEGFFMSVIQKKSEESSRQKVQLMKAASAKFDWQHYLKDADNFLLIEFKNQFFAIHKSHHAFISDCVQRLHVINPGLCMGEIKGHDFVPDTALALSTSLSKESFRITDLTKEDALRYLQKEAVISSHSEKGFELVSYKNQPLGFIKNLGNRSNNLYPKNWRILSRVE
ncbi:MAG: rRNA cytosine-C5-methyltransferase [Crocinitomicaceae bacterium]|nr:rRNA cytosine-C5-methyltransferase [Crocinitomicaceae bacterium]MBK8924933.1 rRNA cytosine-C5-methyltransferase [Crocinitomicaceae bacterium]